MGNLALKLGYIHRDNKNRIMLKKEATKSFYINGHNFGVEVKTIQLNKIEPSK